MNQWPAQILILNSFFHAISKQKTDHFFKVQHVKTTMLADVFFLGMVTTGYLHILVV